MPTSCCVPGCTSNFRNSDAVSVFKFPRDETLRKKWIAAIHRTDFAPGNRSVVCIHHFDEKYIVREDTMTRPDGSTLTIQRSHIKLTAGAVPTNFPSLPSYLSTSVPTPRKNPNQRHAEIEERLVEADFIVDFKDLLTNITKKCNINSDNTVYVKIEETQIWIFKIDTVDVQHPRINTSLSIDSDLVFEVIRDGVVINKNPKIREIIDEVAVKRWSSLLRLYKLVFESDLIPTAIDRLGTINRIIDDLEKDTEKGNIDKIRFCKEQLNLAMSKKLRYSPATLTWFATMQLSYPNAYRMMRRSKFLTMPHSVYLRTFTSKVGETSTSSQ